MKDRFSGEYRRGVMERANAHLGKIRLDSEIGPIWEALFAEGDRSAAIIGFAWIDEALSEATSRIVVQAKKSERDWLLRPGGILSTTHNRVEMLFSFGFLAKDQYQDLRLLTRIRNIFGHKSSVELSFDTEPIASLVAKLQVADNMHSGLRSLGQAPDSERLMNTPRGRFIASIGYLKMQLELTAATAPRRQVPENWVFVGHV